MRTLRSKQLVLAAISLLCCWCSDANNMMDAGEPDPAEAGVSCQMFRDERCEPKELCVNPDYAHKPPRALDLYPECVADPGG